MKNKASKIVVLLLICCIMFSLVACDVPVAKSDLGIQDGATTSAGNLTVAPVS